MLDGLLGLFIQFVLWSIVGAITLEALPAKVERSSPAPDSLAFAAHFYDAPHILFELGISAFALLLFAACNRQATTRRLQEDLSRVLYAVAMVTVMLAVLSSRLLEVFLPWWEVWCVAAGYAVFGVGLGLGVEIMLRWRASWRAVGA